MDLELTVEHICDVIAEWDPMGYPWNAWREYQTRYFVIDPIIRALGWDTIDPKECSIEYFIRDARGESGWADYALFLECDIQDIVDGTVQPTVLVEAKSLRMPLDVHVRQLAWYVQAANMTKGLGVLTSGTEWWIYDTAGLVSPCPLPLATVDITRGRGGAAASILRQRLSRAGLRSSSSNEFVNRP